MAHGSKWKIIGLRHYTLQEGKTVKVKIEPLYRGTDTRPRGFRVLYSFDNGKFNKITFKNSPGGI